MWRRLWRSLSTVLPRGSKTGHWHQRGGHASWRWRPNPFANGIGSKMGKLEFPARGWMNAVPLIRLSVGIPDQATCTITHAWIKRDGNWYYEPIAVQIRP